VSALTSTLPQVEIIEYRLRLSRDLRRHEAGDLRGFFGRAFADEILLHHHEQDGSLRYQYPVVQFKVLRRTAHLIGLADGAALLSRLWAQVDHTRIGGEDLQVLEATLSRRVEMIGAAGEAVEYRFVTPWLGLNQENHRRYEADASPERRQALLDSILRGNCLSLAKAFGHRVETRLSADPGGLRPFPTTLKGVPMLGFVGTVRINFLLPDRVGIGKSVSRGFGTVERVTPREGA
jgi:hypothetical protein